MKGGNTPPPGESVIGTKLEGIVKDLTTLDRFLFLRTKHTGSWMTVLGTTVTGTVLLSI